MLLTSCTPEANARIAVNLLCREAGNIHGFVLNGESYQKGKATAQNTNYILRLWCEDNNIDLMRVQLHHYCVRQVEPCHLLGWSSQAIFLSNLVLGAMPKQQQQRVKLCLYPYDPIDVLSIAPPPRCFVANPLYSSTIAYPLYSSHAYAYYIYRVHSILQHYQENNIVFDISFWCLPSRSVDLRGIRSSRSNTTAITVRFMDEL